MHRGNLARRIALSGLAAIAVAGCKQDIADLDGVFYNGDHRTVHCGVNLDTSARSTTASIDDGLDRARDRHEVLELYAHHPGVTVPVDRIEHVLAGAVERGLAFFTYTDFARDVPATGGLALSFDDTFVDAWVDLRPLFQQYHARVTFFVSRYATLGDPHFAGLHLLAADGHDVEPHTVNHLHAPAYVDDHGIDAYLREELDPSIDVLRADGFEVNAFAYPFGARTGELDAAIAKRVPVIRSVDYAYALSDSPCPR